VADPRLLARYRLHTLALRQQLVDAGLTPTDAHAPEAVPMRMTEAALLWIEIEREEQDMARLRTAIRRDI
jgi:hypothetical protein